MSGFENLPDWFYTTVITLVIAVLAYLNRQRLGLGEHQVAAREADERTIEMQERQIEMLQEEIRVLRNRVEHLENVVADYQIQVRLLREERGDPDDVR